MLSCFFYIFFFQAGLIDPFEGGVISLDTFYKGTTDICSYPNADQPFACLDMLYIHGFLTDGLGLDGSTKLNVCEKCIVLLNTYFVLSILIL